MADFRYHTQCDQCGSSDARSVYSDGSTWCFSCETRGELKEEQIDMLEDVQDFTPAAAPASAPNKVRGFRERLLTKQAVEVYGITVREDGDRIAEHWYPYPSGGYKVRGTADKSFKTVGQMKTPGLFGQDKFGTGKRLVITEGELDAVAVQQANLTKYGRTYPVVSVPHGAQSAAKAILESRDWVRGFESVVIMFDEDEPGREAAEECAKVVGIDKALIAKLPAKDACDVLKEHGAEALVQASWNAVRWTPAGVLNAADTWDSYVAELDAVYQEFPGCLSGLNEKIFGVRTGSITMITSGSGCGKTTAVKEFLFNVLNTTEESIGIVSLEESVAETVRGFISMKMNQRIGLPGVDVELEAQREVFDQLFSDGRVFLLDHQGSVSDDSLIDKLEFLALSGCKYLILDPITLAVSEGAGESNVNAAIDALMSDLLKLCKKHDIHIMVVSHLRKVSSGNTSFEEGASISMDSLKGSASLKQVSAQVIALSRNMNADDPEKRSLVQVRVLKDRWTGYTGPAGAYRFDGVSGRLVATEFDEFLSTEEEL